MRDRFIPRHFAPRIGDLRAQHRFQDAFAVRTAGDILIAMKARTRIPEHQTEGRISIQTIRGHIQVRANGRTFDLPSGGLLALDQSLRHDVEALEDSAFLLSIA